ncbi:hypothetical protein GN956_G12254 [Arapaima gigas]
MKTVVPTVGDEEEEEDGDDRRESRSGTYQPLSVPPSVRPSVCPSLPARLPQCLSAVSARGWPEHQRRDPAAPQTLRDHGRDGVCRGSLCFHRDSARAVLPVARGLVRYQGTKGS